MSRTALWSYLFALAGGVLCIAAVLFIVIPAYLAAGAGPAAGAEVIWYPMIAQGVQMNRAAWLMCGSTSAFASVVGGLRRPSTPVERLALGIALGGAVLSAGIWIRYGSRMLSALAWTLGHESVAHWFP
jgi:hypothetical protein